jgi:hypothetical protein
MKRFQPLTPILPVIWLTLSFASASRGDEPHGLGGVFADPKFFPIAVWLQKRVPTMGRSSVHDPQLIGCVAEKSGATVQSQWHPNRSRSGLTSRLFLALSDQFFRFLHYQNCHHPIGPPSATRWKRTNRLGRLIEILPSLIGAAQVMTCDGRLHFG